MNQETRNAMHTHSNENLYEIGTFTEALTYVRND